MMIGRCLRGFSGLGLVLALAATPAFSADCSGGRVSGLPGTTKAWRLSDGSIVAFAKMNINIDGYGRAYHPENATAGAVIHLCNAGRVFLPGGTRYEGSESNATCTGRFMNDVARIRAAGWKDPAVGVVQWYGILAKESARINGLTIEGVVPAKNRDGSDFYVSPTALADTTIADPADQSRYVDPVRVPAAVIPKSLMNLGVRLGSFGVAIDQGKRIAVPFIVGDAGPRIGEGTPALARRVAGLPALSTISRADRFAGQVDTARVLWVFFAGAAKPYDSRDTTIAIDAAAAAFESWGGEDRLKRCLTSTPGP